MQTQSTTTTTTIQCDCGGRYTPINRNKHLRCQKHRRYLGEDVVRKPRAPNSKPHVPKANPIIGSLMVTRVKDCTPEELEKRRAYVREKTRQYRARKKAVEVEPDKIEFLKSETA